MLGEKLKKQRQSMGLTQQEVADHLHVSRQTISNWEVGRNFPDIPMIISISDYYQISLDELLKGDEQLMDKMKKDAELIKRTKRRKIFDRGLCGDIAADGAFCLYNEPDTGACESKDIADANCRNRVSFYDPALLSNYSQRR
ncbi:MAG: helix-turn-helix domain-containing protein [Enterococcus raffinosus]